MNLKSAVLKRLENNRGAYISGEEMATELCVSRQAISKAISSLKADGYTVSAVSNRGYMLGEDCDKLSADIIAEKTAARCAVYDSVASTNDTALREYITGGECIIVGKTQTGGKTKDGKDFYSPCDKGIYFSAALTLSVPVTETEKIIKLCCDAVSEVISDACGKQTNILNGNEIYIEGKKVCGILVECTVNASTLLTECVVIGIGIYTSEPFFDDTVLASIYPEDTRNNMISEIYLKIKKSLR